MYDDNVRCTITYDYDDDDERRMMTTTMTMNDVRRRRTTTYDDVQRRTTTTYNDDDDDVRRQMTYDNIRRGQRRTTTTTYDDDVRQRRTTTTYEVRQRCIMYDNVRRTTTTTTKYDDDDDDDDNNDNNKTRTLNKLCILHQGLVSASRLYFSPFSPPQDLPAFLEAGSPVHVNVLSHSSSASLPPQPWKTNDKKTLIPHIPRWITVHHLGVLTFTMLQHPINCQININNNNIITILQL